MKKKELSFSKKYFAYLIALEFFVILFTGVMIVITCDATPLQWIITALAAEISVYSAWYLAKARTENRHKYAQLYVKQIADQYGVDVAIRIAEVVLRE